VHSIILPIDVSSIATLSRDHMLFCKATGLRVTSQEFALSLLDCKK
jgi:hypothetical protein